MEPRLSHLVARRALEVAASRLAVEPVVAAKGPPTVGRSTLLQQLARELGADIVDLGDPALREIAPADPAMLVAGRTPCESMSISTFPASPTPLRRS